MNPYRYKNNQKMLAILNVAFNFSRLRLKIATSQYQPSIDLSSHSAARLNCSLNTFLDHRRIESAIFYSKPLSGFIERGGFLEAQCPVAAGFLDVDISPELTTTHESQ